MHIESVLLFLHVVGIRSNCSVFVDSWYDHDKEVRWALANGRWWQKEHMTRSLSRAHDNVSNRKRFLIVSYYPNYIKINSTNCQASYGWLDMNFSFFFVLSSDSDFHLHSARRRGNTDYHRVWNKSEKIPV